MTSTKVSLPTEKSTVLSKIGDNESSVTSVSTTINDDYVIAPKEVTSFSGKIISIEEYLWM